MLRSSIRSLFTLQSGSSAAFYSNKRGGHNILDSSLVSVVKVLTITRTTDSDTITPWTYSEVYEGNGSGFIISKKRIITNAHVVTDARCVRIMKVGSGIKYTAKVLAFGHDCDLAVLTVESKEFWRNMKALRVRRTMPRLSETVKVIGFPEGGDSISITSGIVSRLLSHRYSHSKLEANLPAFQIDAAINHGNSGGPVFIGHVVAGIAFEGLPETQNIGYVIPSPLLLLFLSSIERKEGVGCFSSIGLITQSIENIMIRNFFKVNQGMTGVFVTSESVRLDANDIRMDDVLLSVDGIPIQNDGEVTMGMDLDSFIALKKPFETVRIEILRDGIVSIRTVQIDNVNKAQEGKDYPPPSYLIFGGIVFINMEPQGVKISQVLEDEINMGYTCFMGEFVDTVDGEQVFTVGDVKVEIERAKDHAKDVKIGLQSGEVMILNFELVEKAKTHILKTHHIPFEMSQDLVKIEG